MILVGAVRLIVFGGGNSRAYGVIEGLSHNPQTAPPFQGFLGCREAGSAALVILKVPRGHSEVTLK